jgi:hypothetical protein
MELLGCAQEKAEVDESAANCLQNRLFIVQGVATVTGRGTVLLCDKWESGQARVGDWVQIRSKEGESLFARISSLEWGGKPEKDGRVAQPGYPSHLLFTSIKPGDVAGGDEVWSVAPEVVPAELREAEAQAHKPPILRRLLGLGKYSV